MSQVRITTTLHEAAKNGHKQICELLLNSGADFFAKDIYFYHNTVLDIAKKEEFSHKIDFADSKKYSQAGKEAYLAKGRKLKETVTFLPYPNKILL